jgi:hypothetical protein
MNALFNPHLFRHREATTAGFNNLCTVIHRIREPGEYLGSIVYRDQLLGSFKLRCEKEAAATQVDVDVSKFDPLLRTAAGRDLSVPHQFSVSPDGYAVFFASSHHNGVHVTLTSGQKTVFDSRKLDAGDLAVFRLVYPGTYRLADRTGDATLHLRVREAEDGHYPQLTKLAPVTVTLSDRGFDPAKLEKWPVQALVIRLEKSAVLELTSDDLAAKRAAKAK